MYKERIKKICFMTLIGYIVSVVVLMMMERDAGFAFGVAIFFSTIPYGWHTINKVVGGWGVVGSIPIVIGFFMLKLFASLFLGWIITPVVLIYNIVMLIIKSKEKDVDEIEAD